MRWTFLLQADSGHLKVIPDWLKQRFNSPSQPSQPRPSRSDSFPNVSHIDLLVRIVQVMTFKRDVVTLCRTSN